MKRAADLALGLVAAGIVVGMVASEAVRRVRRWAL